MTKLRRIITASLITSEFFMLYLYHRHNNLCEAYIYSYFCMVEYAVVLGQMFYIMIALPLIDYPILTIKACTESSEFEIHPNKRNEKVFENEIVKNIGHEI